MRTSRLWRRWKQAGAPQQVVKWIQHGYRIPFKSQPTSWNFSNPPPADDNERLGRPPMWRKLVSKQILYPWSAPDTVPTFVSPLRGEAKHEEGQPTGEYRPICNLRQLNSFVADRQVRYENLRLLPSITTRYTWTTSMDLKSFFDSFRLHPKDHRFTVVRAPASADPAAVSVDSAGFPLLADGTRTYKPSHYYAYGCLPQGFKLSPYVIVKCMRWLIQKIRSRADGVNILQFVDDFLLMGPRNVIRAFSRSVRRLLVILGFIIHPAKGWQKPCQRFVFLGMGVDLRLREFHIPEYKLVTLTSRCVRTLQHARSHQRLVPVKALARLTGTAISLYLAAPIMPYFLRSLHDCIKTRRNWRGTVRLTTQACHDIQSLATLVRAHRQSSFAPPRTTAVLTTDASTRGGGGWTRTPDGAMYEVSYLWDRRYTCRDICYLEMRAVLRCLQACFDQLKGQHVTLRTDNMAVLVCLNTKSSRSQQLMLEYRDVYQQLQTMKSSLQAIHIDTKSNWHADGLSRARDPQDYGWTLALLLLAIRHWALTFSTDCFASRRFHHDLPYHSRWADEQSTAVNTFSTTWSGTVWLAPPLSLIHDCLLKVRADQCSAVLVAPDWGAQPWYPQLQALTTASITFNVADYLETSDCNLAPPECLRNPKWRWKLWLLNGLRN